MTKFEREHLAKMVYEAVRFSLWAAGEGLSPVKGEPAFAPEDFLFDYSHAMDLEDWDGLPQVAQEAILSAVSNGGR
jgi:hypothetical protein